MLCPTCPKRSVCKTMCADLNRELARGECPQIGFTKTPQQLEGIELRNAIQSYFRNESEEMKQVEVNPVVPTVSHEALYSALEELTSRQRECLHLFFWQGFSKKKIAEKLGLSRQTIIQHIDAAITSIRTRYEEVESTDTYTCSLAATVEKLNGKGMTTKQHLKKDGTPFGAREWTLKSLWRVLHNRHYLGEREVYRKGRQQPEIVKASWPAIVSKDLFNSVQNVLKANHLRYKPESARTFDYIYSSLVFCPSCKTQLIGLSGKGKKGIKYVYYAHKKSAQSCPVVRFDAEKLHDLVRRRFKALAKDDALIQKLYQDADLEKVVGKPQHEQRFEGLKKELRKLKTNASNLLDQIQNWKSGEVPDLLHERLQSLESKIAAIEAEKQSLEFELESSTDNVVDATELFEFVKSIDKHFSKLTQAERRQFVRAFIGRIELHPEELHIAYNHSRDYVAAAAQVLESKSESKSNKPQSGLRPDWGLFTLLIGSPIEPYIELGLSKIPSLMSMISRSLGQHKIDGNGQVVPVNFLGTVPTY